MEFHVLIRVMRGVYRNNPPLWLRNVAPQTVKPWGTPLFFRFFRVEYTCIAEKVSWVLYPGCHIM